MAKKISAIDRLLLENPYLKERRFGLPYIGGRSDGDSFNPTVQNIADAIDYYGYEIRDENIVTMPDIDLGTGNPTNYPAFPLSIKKMKEALDKPMYKYPYTEGDDNIRKVLLDYIEKIGFVNSNPYNYDDVDGRGLSVHNITFLPSTSIIFNVIVNIISNPGDVLLVTGPNYGLFTIRGERAGAEVEIINLEKEDGWLINPQKLANKIDDINDSLQKVYNRRKGYVPRVVGFLNANPNNPTGKVMGERDIDRLKEIGEVCRERGVFIIDDLVYRDLTYDEENIAKPIATIPGMFRNTISLFGLSKSYGMASLRAGFVVADEIIIREVINRIFQGMDSAPDIVGRALEGSFNVSKERDKLYKNYFSNLRNIYKYKYDLLKALVNGIDSINDSKDNVKIKNEIKKVINNKDICDNVLKGLPYTHFPKNLEPEAGFFAILDFTEIKGMKYNGLIINDERDLLQFFYKASRIRFLVGKSISWPYENELVGRVSYAIDDKLLITALMNMNIALSKLTKADNYVIRKNELKDQEQIARIKIDSCKTAYDMETAAKFMKTLNYEEQTERYIASFDDYKDLVFVADKNGEILGYACYVVNNDFSNYESELVSLYVKEEYMGKGIGTSLFNETMKELSKVGIKNIIIWCFDDNKKAIKYYEKLGGKKVEEKIVKFKDNYYTKYGYYFTVNK